MRRREFGGGLKGLVSRKEVFAPWTAGPRREAKFPKAMSFADGAGRPADRETVLWAYCRLSPARWPFRGTLFRPGSRVAAGDQGSGPCPGDAGARVAKRPDDAFGRQSGEGPGAATTGRREEHRSRGCGLTGGSRRKSPPCMRGSFTSSGGVGRFLLRVRGRRRLLPGCGKPSRRLLTYRSGRL